jgi:hypothetical protein
VRDFFGFLGFLGFWGKMMKSILWFVMMAVSLCASAWAVDGADSGVVKTEQVELTFSSAANPTEPELSPAALILSRMRVVPESSSQQIEQIPFRLGISSVTVERLAKAQGCVGGKGAGAITEKAPIEMYRMQCDSGRQLLARCELRQCAVVR